MFWKTEETIVYFLSCNLCFKNYYLYTFTKEDTWTGMLSSFLLKLHTLKNYCLIACLKYLVSLSKCSKSNVKEKISLILQ